ncbi:MAG: hypothetical protein ABL962_21715 [Fimbriimonadaceae bacterium]
MNRLASEGEVVTAPEAEAARRGQRGLALKLALAAGLAITIGLVIDLTRDPTHEEWAVVTTTAVQPMQYVDNQGKASSASSLLPLAIASSRTIWAFSTSLIDPTN